MHLTDEQLRSMTEEALEDFYDWCRFKYKACLRSGDFAWAHSFNALAGEVTAELSNRYRWVPTPRPVVVLPPQLFSEDGPRAS